MTRLIIFPLLEMEFSLLVVVKEYLIAHETFLGRGGHSGKLTPLVLPLLFSNCLGDCRGAATYLLRYVRHRNPIQEIFDLFPFCLKVPGGDR